MLREKEQREYLRHIRSCLPVRWLASQVPYAFTQLEKSTTSIRAIEHRVLKLFSRPELPRLTLYRVTVLYSSPSRLTPFAAFGREPCHDVSRRGFRPEASNGVRRSNVEYNDVKRNRTLAFPFCAEKRTKDDGFQNFLT